MTVRTNAFGATDWVGSEILTSADLNQTFNYLVSGTGSVWYRKDNFLISGTNAGILYFAGNRLGLGTKAPADILELYTPSTPYIKIQDGNGFLNMGIDSLNGSVAFYNTNTAHRFLVDTGTTEAMRIINGGKVGIGIGSPQTTLHVNNATADASIRTQGKTFAEISLFDGAGNTTYLDQISGLWNGITNPAVIQSSSRIAICPLNSPSTGINLLSNGKVGIGIVNPNYLLHLNSAAGQHAMIQLSNATTGSGTGDGANIYVPDSTKDLYLYNVSSGAVILGTNNIERMRIAQSGNTGFGAVAPLGLIHMYRAGGTAPLTYANGAGLILDDTQMEAGAPYTKLADIVANADSSAAGALRMLTTFAGSGPTERMRIDAAGNVGIGTNGPTSKLHVMGGIISAGSSNGVNTYIQLKNDTNPIAILASDTSIYGGSINDVGLYVYSGTGGGNLDFSTSNFRRMRILANGKIGVGTISPGDFFSNTALNVSDENGTGNTGAEGITWITNTAGYSQALYQSSVAANAQGLLVKIAGTASGNKAFTVNTGSTSLHPGKDLFAVQGNGNVGIGTTNPLSILHILGATTPLRLDRPAVDAYTFGITNNGTSDELIISTIKSGTDLFAIQTNGNIGIGTMNAAKRLHVSGVDSTGIEIDAPMITTKTTTGSYLPMTVNGSQFYVLLYA